MKKEHIFCLYKELSRLSDKRRSQGKRHKIELIVMLIILSIMNGYNGFHAIDDFVKKYHNDLLIIFKVKRLPSYSTMRRGISKINFDELNNIFEKWTRTYVK